MNHDEFLDVQMKLDEAKEKFLHLLKSKGSFDEGIALADKIKKYESKIDEYAIEHVEPAK